METIGISCSCNNTEAFKLSQTAAECTSCSTIHTITDEPVFITRSITPLHEVIEQRAKDKAFEDMCISTLQDYLNEWDVETNDAWIKEQLDSMHRRNLAAQYACALDEELITQKEHDNIMHSLNKEQQSSLGVDWSTCFDTNNISYAV